MHSNYWLIISDHSGSWAFWRNQLMAVIWFVTPAHGISILIQTFASNNARVLIWRICLPFITKWVTCNTFCFIKINRAFIAMVPILVSMKLLEMFCRYRCPRRSIYKKSVYSRTMNTMKKQRSTNSMRKHWRKLYFCHSHIRWISIVGRFSVAKWNQKSIIANSGSYVKQHPACCHQFSDSKKISIQRRSIISRRMSNICGEHRYCMSFQCQSTNSFSMSVSSQLCRFVHHSVPIS